MGQVVNLAAFKRQIDAADAARVACLEEAFAAHEIPRPIACAFTWIYGHLSVADVVEITQSHQTAAPDGRKWSVGSWWVDLYFHRFEEIEARRLLGLDFDRLERAAAMLRYWLEIGKQMATPAKSKSHLRWKKDHCQFIGGHPNWDAAIAADAAALTRKTRKAK